VEGLTDNKNRTAANVRNAFTKGYGNVGSIGCVSFMFDRKGQIIIDKEECDMKADDLMMIALDAGAEDFSPDGDVYEITTSPEDFSQVRQALEGNGLEFISAEVSMVPSNTVSLDNEGSEKLERMIDRLEEDDDIQNVWHNGEFPEGWGEEE
jgi:YebC/PmpR family DNA-binding regulatory protein